MASSFIPSPKLNEKSGTITRRRANTVLTRSGDSCFKGCSARHVNSDSVVQCRFSYATWCPICKDEERSKTIFQVGRRRSKSEGMDIEKSEEYYNKASSMEMFKLQSHLGYSKNYQYSMTNFKSSDSCDYYVAPQKVHHSHSFVEPVVDFNRDDEKIIRPMCKPCENHLEPNRGFCKTWKYFEKDQPHFSNHRDDKFRPLHERYYNEVEILRNKLHKLKDASTDIEKSKIKQSHEFLAPNLSSVEVGLKRTRDNSLSLNRPKTSPCSSRKLLPCTPSSKSYPNKSALHPRELYMLSSESSSSVSSDSDYNDSGCEEEDLKDGSELEFEEDENTFLASPKASPLSSRFPSHLVKTSRINKAGNKRDPVVQNNLHPGLRASLFSYVPPYIMFSTHDVKGAVLPSTIQKLLKWKLSTITPVVVRKTVANSNFKLVRKSNEWCGTWGKHMKSLCFKTVREYQKINHFPGTFQIGRKDRLWKNLFRLMTKFGKKEFGFIPRTYVLPQDSKLLRSAWEKNCGKEKWIVKPPASARGTGIKVIHKWTQIPKKCPLVVQKYISDPYLINGSKFDLRLYVLVTSINPMRVYMFDNGLVRFASVKYSNEMTSLADRYMHLTNYSINKLSSQYTQNEDVSACQGHKWSLQAMWTYLERERRMDVKAIKSNLVDLVIKTIISGESAISQLSHTNLASRYCSYELFGVDVLLDEWLKPWLLEVNISPSLHSSSPLDLAVKGPLVQDLMNIVGYQIPNKLSSQVQTELAESLGVQSDLCFDRRLYTTALSNEERLKHVTFQQAESRDEYLETILQDLTPDDIRHLIQYEDELTQIGNFQKIFPTSQSYDYHKFFEAPRYYNMLFDAWEIRQSKDRTKGIMLLESLCKKQIHLDTTQIPPKRTKVCMSPSENSLRKTNQDLLEDIPEVLEEDMNIAVRSKIRNKLSISHACGTICRAARPRSGKPVVVTKPYPRSSYVARRSIKSADSYS